MGRRMGNVMQRKFSKLLDNISEFLAARKGLLPLVGLFLIGVNLILELIIPGSWLTRNDLLLHLGVILAILGILLAWSL